LFFKEAKKKRKLKEKQKFDKIDGRLRGLRLCMSAWVSVGLPSRLDRVFAHRIRGLLVSLPRLFL
jgi:hypothetical protein